MLRMTRLYLACGGMPAAVDQLVRTQDLARVLAVQRDIVELYRQDIARYAPNKPHVKTIFDAMLEQPVQFELVQGDAGINNGALLETLAAQELVANGYDLRYFDKSRYGEVDFVLPDGPRALPVEIKSGASYRRHKALDNVMGVAEWGIDEALVFCSENVQVQGGVSYLPWYMLMFCKARADDLLLVSW